MKILYIDASMGAAGDMLAGALLDLLDERARKAALEKINAAGLDEVKFAIERGSKCGIAGSHVRGLVGEDKEEEAAGESCEKQTANASQADRLKQLMDWSDEQNHKQNYKQSEELNHDQEHHDYHNLQCHTLEQILAIISGLKLSDTVKNTMIQVYTRIAEAESKVHGKPVAQIHFHEVGMWDAIADIMACAILMEEIVPDKVVVSPVNTGFGTVKCAHGILPVPAPATALLLKGMPSYAGEIEGELCTPTGAALLAHFATEFGHQSLMKASAVGYGLGTKDFAVANALRCMLGEADSADESDLVVELSCNIDDMTGEDLGFACEVLLAAGAKDVYVTPVYMKKNRPGQLLTVICAPEDESQMTSLIFKHTTTIGLRKNLFARSVLNRSEEELQTELGSVHLKHAAGFGVSRSKVEFEDLKRIALENEMSLAEVRKLLETEI